MLLLEVSGQPGIFEQPEADQSPIRVNFITYHQNELVIMVRNVHLDKKNPYLHPMILHTHPPPPPNGFSFHHQKRTV